MQQRIIRFQIDDKRVFISHSSKDLDVGEAHNEFKDNLIKELRLPPVANWPQIRDEFLSEIANK